MKVVRYQSKSVAQPVFGLLHEQRVFPFPSDAPFLASHDAPAGFLAMSPSERQSLAQRALQGAGLRLQEVTLRCPLPHPGKFLALAANFSAGGRAALSPEAMPWIFDKRTDDVAGPGDPIVLWPFAKAVVPEIELAVVIGRDARNVSVAEALSYVGAYTVCNDVSARELDLPQGRRAAAFDEYMDWLNGKWLDGYGILGPALVTPDEVNDPQALNIVQRVNGNVVLNGDTRDQIHSVAEVIAFASRLFTLRAGDVITTGTPHGEGPETFLSAGDLVEGEVTGLGVLRNPVVAGK
jgi:2-keto-4-pentenoate hydratase/2-oxohepta-3-ene-1,7-dioic acid hydratase in catechol pathway